SKLYIPSAIQLNILETIIIIIFMFILYYFSKKILYRLNIWNELHIVVPFRSNWKKAKSIIIKIIEENSKETIPKAKSRLQYVARMYSLLNNEFDSKVYTRINYE